MLDSRLFQSIATARLEQWAVFEDGAVFVGLTDRRHEARLEPAQWHGIVDRYRAAVEAARKQLRMLMLATIPLGLAVLGIIASIPMLYAALTAFDRAVPLVLPLLITSGLPIWAITRHGRAVQQALDRARRELIPYPRFPKRHRPPTRATRAMEKVAIFATVPLLLVQVWGTIDPDAYRNTPWTGTRLGLSSLVLALVLGAVLSARWRSGRLAKAVETEAGHKSAAGIATRGRGPSPAVD